MFIVNVESRLDENMQGYLKIEKIKNGNTISNFTIKIGDEFIVKPENKLKKKHRDRRVRILKFVPRKGEIKASVTFLDNNRWGVVPLEDLEPMD